MTGFSKVLVETGTHPLSLDEESDAQVWSTHIRALSTVIGALKLGTSRSIEAGTSDPADHRASLR